MSLTQRQAALIAEQSENFTGANLEGLFAAIEKFAETRIFKYDAHEDKWNRVAENSITTEDINNALEDFISTA